MAEVEAAQEASPIKLHPFVSGKHLLTPNPRMLNVHWPIGEESEDGNTRIRREYAPDHEQWNRRWICRIYTRFFYKRPNHMNCSTLCRGAADPSR